MAEICSCGDGITVFGQPSCVPSFGRDARIVFVQYLDNTGAVNSVKSTDVLDATFFEDKINAGAGSSVLDASLRWNITETINNVTNERGDNVTEDIDGYAINVEEGVRTYDGTFYGAIANPVYVKSLKSMSCAQVGYFIIDVNGNVIGMENLLTGDLDPIKMKRSTLQVKYNPKTSSASQNINIKFAVAEGQEDGNLSQAIVSLTDTLALRSLINVNGVSSAPATTGVVVTANLSYGNYNNKIPFEGAVLADFDVYNVTTASIVTPSAVTESPAGVYTFLYTVLSADVLTIDLDKTGFVMGTVDVVTP